MQYSEFGYEPGHGEHKQAWQALHRPSGPMQCLQLGYESGRGKHKQTSLSSDGALRTIWSLELGYEPGPGERKQAWQALNKPIQSFLGMVNVSSLTTNLVKVKAIDPHKLTKYINV